MSQHTTTTTGRRPASETRAELTRKTMSAESNCREQRQDVRALENDAKGWLWDDDESPELAEQRKLARQWCALASDLRVELNKLGEDSATATKYRETKAATERRARETTQDLNQRTDLGFGGAAPSSESLGIVDYITSIPSRISEAVFGSVGLAQGDQSLTARIVGLFKLAMLAGVAYLLYRATRGLLAGLAPIAKSNVEGMAAALDSPIIRAAL